jgi:hypothetical protein
MAVPFWKASESLKKLSFVIGQEKPQILGKRTDDPDYSSVLSLPVEFVCEPGLRFVKWGDASNRRRFQGFGKCSGYASPSRRIRSNELSATGHLVFLTGHILSPSNHNEPRIFAQLFLVLLLEKP